MRTRRQFLRDGAAAIGAMALGPSRLWAQAARRPAASGEGRIPPGGLPALEVLLLSRAAFGPRPGELEALRALGSTPRKRALAWVERQLHPEGIPDPELARRLAAAKLSTLDKPLRRLWADHQVAADKLRQAQNAGGGKAESTGGAQAMRDEQALRRQPARELEVAAWLRAVYSERQLFEVLVDFWHDHFSVFAWEPPISAVFTQLDRDVIRPHALGNFRDLLGAVAKSPAMLFYLDGFINQSGNPNENYARELFELHTLGVEHYLGTQDRREVPGYSQGRPIGYVDGDVYEAARAFTGWRVDQGRDSGDTGDFLYFDQWHDRFQKIVLGRQLVEYQPPMKDGEGVLDLLASHPGTARHVCLRLCRRLVGDAPPEALIAAAAKVFSEKRNDPHQLRHVVRAVLLSSQFASTWGAKLRRPFEAAAAALRATGAEFFPSEPFLNNYARLGQKLFAWRTPDGYPDLGPTWAATVPLLERWRLANELCAGALPGVKLDLLEQSPAGAAPAALVSQWARRLLGREASPDTAAVVVEFLAQGRNPSFPLPSDALRDRLAPAVALLLMSPDFQWR